MAAEHVLAVAGRSQRHIHLCVDGNRQNAIRNKGQEIVESLCVKLSGGQSAMGTVLQQGC